MNFEEFKQKYQKTAVQHYTNSVDENPLISVCVQTYQHSAFIKECLDGILMQKTDFAFEILLGDDESTDGTREICLEYANLYPNKIRLFLHSRENNMRINGSATGRFNFLYNLYSAQGKYIALCEGDDYWTDPLKLQKQVDFLEANSDFSLCFHNAKIFNIRLGNCNEKIMHKSLIKSVFETKDVICQWFIPTASILFRNYSDLVFPEWYWHCDSGDIPLILLLSLRGKVQYLDKVMSVYRLHDQGISLTHTGYKKAISMVFIYQNFNIYTNYKYDQEIKKAIVYELHAHLPEIKELKELKQSFKKYLTSLIIPKIKHKLKTNFKFFKT